MDNFINFYPTPRKLLEKITYGKIDWKTVMRVLEPSAGKGDIADFIKECSSSGSWHNHEIEIDCIEINPDLQKIIKGKEYRLIHDDFLTFDSRIHYDLILMNPPFDKGAAHLLHAIKLQERAGGKIICILNAETIKNPYTNERKVLAQKLEQYSAEVTFMENEFTSAERTTNVEIAVIYLDIPTEEKDSFIIGELRKAYEIREQEKSEMTDVAVNDFIEAAVMRYDIEVEAGLKLIQEYKAMVPYILNDVEKGDEKRYYNEPILSLKLSERRDLSENEYIKKVRGKYWRALFEDERFTKAMPNKMREEYRTKVSELSEYDFSYFNIKEIQIQMCQSLVSGIEDSIMKLFDELSYVHSWMPETGNNIHYYNGWSTNKAWYINDKVILPMNCYSSIWKRMEYRYSVNSKLADIEKAFDYLAGVPGRTSYLSSVLAKAEAEGRTKDIEGLYFTLTFYKKGTCHIKFKDKELLKKLNIFGGKGKNMLPPSYGKKKYEDMTEEERIIVDEFDGGKDAYGTVYENQDRFLFSASNEIMKIAG